MLTCIPAFLLHHKGLQAEGRVCMDVGLCACVRVLPNQYLLLHSVLSHLLAEPDDLSRWFFKQI